LRAIGLHIRLNETLTQVAEKALRLELPFFQCFLVLKSTGNLVKPPQEDIESFLALRREHFEDLYIHGSYWINLAGITNTGHRALKRELELAKRLEFNRFVIHPGSAKGGESKLDGIDALARALNELLKHEHDITMMLENTAHGGFSVGGDLHDFALLLQKLDRPENIKFCIDSAHAYSYGYDITTELGRDKFIKLLEDTIGINAVALLHLNDTNEKLGSKIDRHELIGKGRIGIDSLRAFVTHDKLVQIPLLMELPVVDEEVEVQMLTMVRSWHT